MAVPLPNLDDRRWVDLVEEARSLIPLYAPAWTDHNVHDPGIMLTELFAWIAEMDIYWLNRIPEQHRRQFLALVGVWPKPPQPARADLRLKPADNVSPLPLPADVQFVGYDPDHQPVLFRSLHPITLVPGELTGLHLWDGEQFIDLTERRQRGEVLELLGPDPRPGMALYFGFSHAFPKNTPVTLAFTFAGWRAGDDERARIAAEAERRATACRTPDALTGCEPERPLSSPTSTPPTLPHHSVRLAWEYLTKAGAWRALDPSQNQVIDETRALTLNGRVRLTLPGKMKQMPLGAEGQSQYVIRCRFHSGAYDAPPRLQSVLPNGLRVEQAVSMQALSWPIAVDATLPDTVPAAGEIVRLSVKLNTSGEVTELAFNNDGAPRFRLLSYTPPGADQAGSLQIAAEQVGSGTGLPQQVLKVGETAVQPSSLNETRAETQSRRKEKTPRPRASARANSPRNYHFLDVQLYTLEKNGWQSWQQRDDFNASGRADAHFLLDATQGVITFGDGERGRVVPANAPVIASYRATMAAGGNVKPGAITALADTPHNRALLANFDQAQTQIQQITNPLPAVGGAAAETVDQATGRALNLLEQPQRAVTAADFVTLAKETPGVHLARATAWINLHPDFPCFKAPGIVTLIVAPFLPAARPTPSPALRQAIAAYLNARRVIGSRVEIVGPTYTEVAVQAVARACAGVDLGALQQRIAASLDAFFHPLTGGPEGNGWPFGRDVYRSEVLQVIDETPGVDHVLSLNLLSPGCAPSCGNVCLGPRGLVAAAAHKIEVV